MIEFRSDNAAGVAPEILASIAEANHGTAIAYGHDDVTARLEQRVREVFEHETARVFPVTSGTAANSLALTALCPPWGSVLCHSTAHILNSEGGATSMLGGGAVMKGVPGDDFRMTADAVREALASITWGDPHHSQPSVLSFTQPTDMGTIYPVGEIAELSAIARDSGLKVHLDGARIANALVALGCSPADLTWRAGIDAVSLGATKNGGLSAEAIVVFDDRAADELVYRTKRSGHVTSKMRFQSTQVLAYLADDLWLRMARQLERSDGTVGGRAGRAPGRVRQPPRREHAVRAVVGRGDRPADRGRPAVLPDERRHDPARHQLADHRGTHHRSSVSLRVSARIDGVMPGSDPGILLGTGRG